MTDQPNPNRNLSDISHLFLSSVRQRHFQDKAAPQRKPPKTYHTIDLTPEEFAQTLSDPPAAAPSAADAPAPAPADPAVRIPPVAAIIAPHLNGKQHDQVKRYARHLAAAGRRVGLIEIDAAEFRLMTFDTDAGDEANAPAEAACFDARAMAEALDELSWDLDCWLLLVGNHRSPEARELLRHAGHWILLSTCDHDGVVSAYRSLKGVADLGCAPRLSVGILDPKDTAQADSVYRKISGVCNEFLHWPAEPGPSVRDVQNVCEHVAMCCRPHRDKAQLAGAPHWQVVGDFLARAAAAEAQSPTATECKPTMEAPIMLTEQTLPPQIVADVVVPVPSPARTAAAPANPAIAPAAPAMVSPLPLQAPRLAAPADADDASEVLDLSDAEQGPAGILVAILRSRGGELAECQVRPPACPQARLAVSRDRRLVLLAVASHGLADLQAIAQAYRWLSENRQLIAMALPQFAIDCHQLPHLRLLISHNDADADLLQPMLQSGAVTVQTFRRVKWAGKSGLLLEAA